jgi:hypothetical protein
MDGRRGIRNRPDWAGIGLSWPPSTCGSAFHIRWLMTDSGVCAPHRAGAREPDDQRKLSGRQRSRDWLRYAAMAHACGGQHNASSSSTPAFISFWRGCLHCSLRMQSSLCRIQPSRSCRHRLIWAGLEHAAQLRRIASSILMAWLGLRPRPHGSTSLSLPADRSNPHSGCIVLLDSSAFLRQEPATASVAGGNCHICGQG